MSTRIQAACSPGEARVAMLRDDELIDYGIWRPGAPDGVGDVHRGRVMARMPAMAGAFIALAGSEGFLPDSAGATGLGVGAIYDLSETYHLLASYGPGIQNAAETDRMTWYTALEFTF